MALLTDSPRTATVVAETDLTVWRLSRSRFETLLDHERGIARSIERSLSLRLAAMNHETGALRAFSHRLTAAALGRSVSPAGSRPDRGRRRRTRWNAEILRRTCARTGDEARLTELVEQSALLHAEGTELVVDPTFLALAGPGLREPNPAWLRAAAEEMAAAGEVIGATDLALAAGAVEDAEKLLGAHETRLLQTASAGDLDRWLEDGRRARRRPSGRGSPPCAPGSASGWRPPRNRRRPGQPRAPSAPHRAGRAAGSPPCAR